jgi:hypothetical protein
MVCGQRQAWRRKHGSTEEVESGLASQWRESLEGSGNRALCFDIGSEPALTSPPQSTSAFRAFFVLVAPIALRCATRQDPLLRTPVSKPPSLCLGEKLFNGIYSPKGEALGSGLGRRHRRRQHIEIPVSTGFRSRLSREPLEVVAVP